MSPNLPALEGARPPIEMRRRVVRKRVRPPEEKWRRGRRKRQRRRTR